MPSKEDSWKDHVWITTFTDRRFHLYGDDPDDICLEDIAHATGMIVRYTGHIKEFYSVAEHQVMVARIIEYYGGNAHQQLEGLFHDATEAYLCDVAAPFKRELGNYHDLEDAVWKRIAAKYGLPEVHDPLVKLADWTALFIEAKYLVTADESQWLGYEEHGKAAEFFMDQHPDVVPICHNPKAAKQMWIDCYRRLTGNHEGELE